MRVLVVEDDPDLSRQIGAALADAGYVFDVADTGEDGHHLGDTEPYDAVILDLGLPVMDGISVLERWRRDGRTMPVLILTARDRWSEKVAGFDAGADDYLAKPFAMEELLARLRALLRRTMPSGESTAMTVADLELDPATRRVRRGGESVDLTKTEFDLLELLMRNAGLVLTRDVIYERIWGFDFGTSSNSLDVYIGYLRRKTETGEVPRLIQTVRGVGYVLREQ